MPEFGSPKTVLEFDKPLNDVELVRAIRFFVAAEYEAVQMYTQVANATSNEAAKAVLKSISDEEVVHAGEFDALLAKLSPDDHLKHQEGVTEAAELMGKIPVADQLRKLAHDILAFKIVPQQEVQERIKQLALEKPLSEEALESIAKGFAIDSEMQPRQKAVENLNKVLEAQIQQLNPTKPVNQSTLIALRNLFISHIRKGMEDISGVIRTLVEKVDEIQKGQSPILIREEN